MREGHVSSLESFIAIGGLDHLIALLFQDLLEEGAEAAEARLRRKDEHPCHGEILCL
jgi:hypothetical protein